MTASPADGAADDDDALASVLGRYPRQPGLRWVNVMFAVMWLALGVAQLIRADTWPWGLVFGAIWAALAASQWVFFAADIRRDGIKLQRRPILPWSEVVDIVIPQERWKGAPVELLLVDGSTAALPLLTR
ncbi:MAG: hypothetical protein ABI112_10845, partial [Terracoccus sp.]